VDCRLKADPNPRLLSGKVGVCGSGEVDGVVDFREEEAVVVRGFEDEDVEADKRSDCFPEDDNEEKEGDLGFRVVAVEMEGPVESCLREVTLVSVVLVETTRLVGSVLRRALGRRGDFEAAFVKVLVTLSTSFWGSVLESARRSALILLVGNLGRTGLHRGLGCGRSTWWFSRWR
jgi:hypothetical protein